MGTVVTNMPVRTYNSTFIAYIIHRLENISHAYAVRN